ncbi:FtsK/SpoIIIE domain-containing protein [Arthrobacter sp. KNU40]|uniref:FtsK/SpoIIIE domain-containing protein n=1 Tax=Arthrobacter sp. KNU40 TaxID=3447965 RepID=UPI003F6019B1
MTTTARTVSIPGGMKTVSGTSFTSEFLQSQEDFRRDFEVEFATFCSIDKDRAKIRALDEFASQIDSQIFENFTLSSRAWKIVQSIDVSPESSRLPDLSTLDEKSLPFAEVRDLFQKATSARKSMDAKMFFDGSDRSDLRGYIQELESYRVSALALADVLEEGIDRKKEAFDAAAARLSARVISDYTAQRRHVDEAQREIGPTAISGFDPTFWEDWTPPLGPQIVSLGTLVHPRPESAYSEALPAHFSYPALMSFEENGRLVYQHDSSGREAAQSAVRALILRLLAAFPAGKLTLTVFDPMGLGDSVGPFLALGDHNKDFIGGKVWSSSADLVKQLSELTTHIEHVITRYLRGEYSTIAEYNSAAGEIAENYRVLVVFDFPAQFTEETQFELKRIMENGPRCGVFTVVVSNSGIKANYGVKDSDLPGIRLVNEESFAGHPFEGKLPLLHFDADPIALLGARKGQDLVDFVVDKVGREGNAAADVWVDLNQTHARFGQAVGAQVRSDIPEGTTSVSTDSPETWWRSSSRDACVSPVGPSSARDVALVRFDSSSMAGGFLIGRMGSGKSTLLHTYLAGLTMLYSPEELELYLIDFREGVEFAAYAQMQLPHARCIAIESEREFGLSVLESIVEEMQRRGRIFRSTGGQQTTFSNIRDLGGEKLTRIVLVFDEFHVLFAQEDKIAAKSAELMETIIRQGRGFGVHVLLASQTLSGMTALPRQTLDLLPVRLLLGSTREDADLVLGEANQGWKLISKPGEGVLNHMGGAVEGNVVFLGAFEEDADRIERLEKLRDKATAEGYARQPVVFEGFKPASLESEPPYEFRTHVLPPNPHVLSLRVGRTMTLAGPANILLRREGGSNVLVVARDINETPLGILSVGLLSILAGTATAKVYFANFISIDEDIDRRLSDHVETGRLELLRPRRLFAVLEELVRETKRRIDEDDDRSPARVLCLYGIHRARDLSSESYSSLDDETGAPSPDELLQEVLRNGPEVGIHVIAWTESVTALERRFNRATQDHFNHILGTRMGREDSGRLFDSDAASKLRDNQLLYADIDAGVERRMMAYATPDPIWTKEVLLEQTRTPREEK